MHIKFLYVSLLALCSCSRDLDCITSEDITERWLEISSSAISFDHCYLLGVDGVVIEKNQETNWRAGDWYVIDHCDDCLFAIGAGDNTIELLEEEGDCLTIEYNGIETEICDCSY